MVWQMQHGQCAGRVGVDGTLAEWQSGGAELDAVGELRGDLHHRDQWPGAKSWVIRRPTWITNRPIPMSTTSSPSHSPNPSSTSTTTLTGSPPHSKHGAAGTQSRLGRPGCGKG